MSGVWNDKGHSGNDTLTSDGSVCNVCMLPFLAAASPFAQRDLLLAYNERRKHLDLYSKYKKHVILAFLVCLGVANILYMY